MAISVPRPSSVAPAPRPAAPAPVRARPQRLAAGGWPRLLAFAALALVASRAWAAQVSPPAHGAALGWTAVAVALGALLLRAPRLGARRGTAAVAVGVVASLALVLLACGVPVRLLRPDAWAELGDGIGQGLAALPDLRVPYLGVDAWVRTVVLGGGGLLALAAAALAFAPRRGRDAPGRLGAAATLLAVLYAVPVVEHNPDAPFASGALFAILLAALLWVDRLGRAQLPGAVALGGAALIAALLVAPRLDARSPWIDYQHLANDIAAASTTSFNWNHTYTPLRWPREGREVLRVKAASSAYWKGVVLEDFDGLRWREASQPVIQGPDTEIAHARADWRQTVTVVARDISSRQLYAPGDVLRVDATDRPALPDHGGTLAVAPGAPSLKPGDSYRVDVYSPRPNIPDMRGAGTRYLDFLRGELHMQLPRSVGGPPLANIRRGTRDAVAELVFPFYGEGGPVRVLTPDNYVYRNGRTLLAHSRYARSYRLAQRLAAASSSPYDLVQRVQRRVRAGAHYTEVPPAAAVPLDDFLFGHRAGYCQQYSGAMALLLRMAGVPARVASGFAPGTYDRKRREYVVRDLDAHSWVEVYFPQIGWVPFDPTPASAPPASQADEHEASAAEGGTADRGDVPERRPGAVPSAADGGSRTVLGLLIAGGALVAALGVALAARAVRRRPGPDEGVPLAVAELRRALVRTGRDVLPGTTLLAIERRLDGDAEAQAYVRALRLGRYGPRGASPTAAQRAALRRALAEGLGPIGRLRAWLALPPRRRLPAG